MPGNNGAPDPDPRAGAAAAPSASDPAVTARYDGAIAYLDFELERLLDYLRKTALDDRSLIIITSDHGEALGERGLYEHGLSVYQDQVYVPLLIKYPGSKEGAAVDQVVSLVDLLPTVLETLGCPIPKEVQGRSLLSRASGRPIPVVSEHFPGIFANSPGVQGYGQRAIFSGSKKFIRSAMGKRELYDFLQDPSEQANLYRAGDPASKEMEDQLDQWLKTVAPQSAAPARLDPDTLRWLKSLGYVQ